MAGALNVLVMCLSVVPVVRETFPSRGAGRAAGPSTSGSRPPQAWGFSSPRGMQNKKSFALKLWSTGLLRRIEP